MGTETYHNIVGLSEELWYRSKGIIETDQYSFPMDNCASTWVKRGFILLYLFNHINFVWPTDKSSH